jgi:hypothetical protein
MRKPLRKTIWTSNRFAIVVVVVNETFKLRGEREIIDKSGMSSQRHCARSKVPSLTLLTIVLELSVIYPESVISSAALTNVGAPIKTPGIFAPLAMHT